MAALIFYSANGGAVQATLNFNAVTHTIQSVTVANNSALPVTFTIARDGGGSASHTFAAGSTTTFNISGALGLTYDPALDTDLQVPANFTVGAKWPA